jgi:hypothetical protein
MPGVHGKPDTNRRVSNRTQAIFQGREPEVFDRHDPQRQGSMVKKLAILSFSVIFSLLFLEGFTRGFLREEVDSEIIRSKFFRVGATPSDDPDLVYELKEGVAFRDNETTSSIKLAVIGDSTPYGWPGKKLSYPYSVARRLKMQLRNYSVPGYNTKQELILFRKYIKQWEPNYVLIHHDGNDADPTARFFPGGYSCPDYGDNFLHSALIKYIARTIKSINPRHIDTKANTILGWSISSGPLYDEHISALKTLIHEAHENGAKVIVVLYDSEKPTEERQSVLRQPLIDLLAECECQVISLNSVWVHRISDENMHPNVEGQKLIADQILREIEL